MPQADGANPNPFIGLILLIVLVIFVMPDRLPQFLSDLSPYLFSGIPCARLPAARELAAHQSVIGRVAEDPLRLELSSPAIAGDGGLQLRMTVINASLGTTPIVFQEDNIAVVDADDGTDGFGIIIEPAPAAGLRERSDPNPETYDEGDVRLLGPRQRCVHSLELTAAQAMIDAGGTALAYYRMSVAGAQQPQSAAARAIYPDQGLDILSESVVFSDQIEIAAASS